MKRVAFTLVELLVVIAIIAMLIGLLLPAINSAREAGRRTTCSNQMKQMGLAVMNHVNEQGWYPTGGWGWNWVGDPNRGFGIAQPGGWTYNILPYMEYDYLYKMGAGVSGSAKQMAGAAEMNQSIVPIYYCPTRRAARTYPFNGPGFPCPGGQPINADTLAGTNVGKTDYAISCGTGSTNDPNDDQAGENGGPGSYAQGDTTSYAWTNYSSPEIDGATNPNFQDGVSYIRSQVTMNQVVRGASHIIVLGEKYLDPDNYTNGYDCGDNEEVFVGQDNDQTRETDTPPIQDNAGNTAAEAFGSAHPGGCNFVAGDGSVHFVAYTVNQEIFAAFGDLWSVQMGTIWDEQ